MATSFLNKAGLTSLWAKIKSTFALKSEIPDVSGKVNKSGDTMTGTLNMNNRILQFHNSNADRADTIEVKATTYRGNYGEYFGELSISQPVEVTQAPSTDYHLTNKEYVDGAISNIAFPVTSVNGQTGDVTLTIPQNVSDLTNDSGFITSIPLATKTTLGGVIVGNYINVANDGTISLDVATDAQVDAFLYENGLLTTNTIDSATIDNATVA